MATELKDGEVREAVGIFSDEAAFQETIDEILSWGFDRAELSLLTDEKAVVRKLGRRYVRAVGLEDDARAPRTDYISPESVVMPRVASLVGSCISALSPPRARS